MRRIGYWLGVACGVVLLGQGTASWAVDMRDGQWETTVVTTMDGAGGAMPAMTSTVSNCLTKDKPVPDANPNPDQAKDCQVLDQKISGNTVSWRVVCNQDGNKMDGSGTMTYQGASYTGTMRTTSVAEGQTMKALMKLSGRYLGPCTDKKGQLPAKGAVGGAMTIPGGAGMANGVPGQADIEKYKAMADQLMKSQGRGSGLPAGQVQEESPADLGKEMIDNQR